MRTTVVIASPDGSSIRDMELFRAQAKECSAELISVFAEGHAARAERITNDCAEPLSIAQPLGLLTPHLWQAGIQATTGELVVLTLNGLAPKPGWLKSHIVKFEKSHTEKVCAIGGSIEPMDGASVIDRAVAFSRYAAFLPPLRDDFVDEVAADNACYARAAMAGCEDLIAQGFWEPPIHARMRKNGWRLGVIGGAPMVHNHSNGFWNFIGQRVKHGCRFGNDRRNSVTTLWVLKYLLLSPALPLVLALRTKSRMAIKGYGAAQWLVVAPFLFCFNLAWTMGEVWGTIAPQSRAGRHLNDRIVS